MHVTKKTIEIFIKISTKFSKISLYCQIATKIGHPVYIQIFSETEIICLPHTHINDIAVSVYAIDILERIEHSAII